MKKINILANMPNIIYMEHGSSEILIFFLIMLNVLYLLFYLLKQEL